jgi:oxygen-independent coproporphyrinogen-3 oxidase
VAEALASIDAPAEVYVHVPFCREQCSYCGCNMVVARRQAAGDRYLDQLQAELTCLPIENASVEVRRVHLGGGTPTWLDRAQLARLVDILRERFVPVEACEWSVEVDPSTVDCGRIDELRKLGFGRISLGVQSLDPVVLSSVGRPQSPDHISAIVRHLQSSGISVSVDLMCGLPHQGPLSLAETVSEVVRWGPARVALFSYAHVPWARKNQAAICSADLPAVSDRAEAILQAWRILKAGGYVRVGMDHFAAPGDALLDSERIHRNFMGYTTHKDVAMIGLGPSAISEVGGVFWQNPSGLRAWYDGTASFRGHQMSSDDRARRRTIENLMCTMECDRQGVLDRSDPGILAELEALNRGGVIALSDERIEVLEPLLVRLVAQVFDAYPSTGRYSELF